MARPRAATNRRAPATTPNVAAWCAPSLRSGIATPPKSSRRRRSRRSTYRSRRSNWCAVRWRRVTSSCANRLKKSTLWKAYRAAYTNEPFVRIVHERGGIYRHPEPKMLAGTNYADVGWAMDEATGRIVALCAIDNLGKGAAGSAVQCINLMHGWEETTGLTVLGPSSLIIVRS